MKYIKYVLKNTEPVRITDDSTSHQGQSSTLTYIPGSSIRGYVVNRFVSKGEDYFEHYKGRLFSESCRFLNAYCAATAEGGRTELIPAPKGFYEDKSDDPDKILKNVVIDDDLPDGFKRSSLGEYVSLEGDTVHTYSLKKGSDLKIKINAGADNNMFRNDYVAPGHEFVGYIAVDDSDTAEAISNLIESEFKVGNARSSGYGLCKVVEKSISEELPYSQYAETSESTGKLYMMLLANTSMRSSAGQYCGINTEELGAMLGVEDLSIHLCSTSLVDVRGFNRIWGAAVPSIRMYDKGSVFQLTYKGTASPEAIKRVMEQGIGVRKNEGFGNVIFLKDYEQLIHKAAGEGVIIKESLCESEKDDDKVIRQIAREYCRYRIEEAVISAIASGKIRLKGVSNSQLGVLESMATFYRNDPEKGLGRIGALFTHGQEKYEKTRVQKSKISSIANTRDFFIDQVVDGDFLSTIGIGAWNDRAATVMGVPVRDLISTRDLALYKLNFISQVIRYHNKEGGHGKND